ncbi:TPA: hypothetical protein N0F65_000852 [Lagenidium giganteum]|uniref:Uncharacterized protein n=1 Tax=Lagenidium giganteum TaxID=4803 RepID=A0AAV2YGR4_9STRA|nr:TPA: hypothetical protein N0F65_000852 [Lagenidium giganteum]
MFVCGMSDIQRSFHLVALFVTSQRTKAQHVLALQHLKQFAIAVNRKHLDLRFMMGDIDVANLTHFQAMAKVYPNVQHMPSRAQAKVSEGLYDLHFEI